MKSYNICLVSVLICFSLGVPVKETHKKIKKGKFVPQFNRAVCRNQLEICNDTLRYPIRAIQKLVKKKKNLTLFSEVSLIEPADDIPKPSVRFDSQAQNLCRTKTVTTFPKAGYDYQSQQQRFIINMDIYRQTVVYETCVEPGKECLDQPLLPFGMKTTCTQKHNIVRLVSLTREGTMEYGKFMVPSTCVCSYFNEMDNTLSAF